MNGRERMTLQGSTPYYLHRIPEAAQSGQLSSSRPPPLGFRASSNPNNNISVAQPVVVRAAPSSLGPTINVDGGGGGGGSQQAPQEFTITVGPTGGTLSEPTKKKRGRPRKYRPDGPASGSCVVALGLCPSTPISGSLAQRKKRGRPFGSGRRQRLSSVAHWCSMH